MQYQRSSSLFKEAQAVIPGGVNSPVRAFKSVGGTPIFVERAKGAYLYDADGNKLIDYISSWGPMILGHAFTPVIDAVKQRADKGTSFGMPTALETEIANLALEMVPNMDKIRFVNSGTEAGNQGREVLMVDVHNTVQGRYRGGALDIQAKAGIDLISSIDLGIQRYGEQLMNHKKGSIVAIEPKTGEVICLISSPTYDPNLLVGVKRAKNYQLLAANDSLNPLFNRALMAKYPPGLGWLS